MSKNSRIVHSMLATLFRLKRQISEITCSRSASFLSWTETNNTEYIIFLCCILRKINE
jgi:hypothetical protein